MYDILIKRESIINKKNFLIGLTISALINFFILSMFSLMSKIVKPAELPKEPIIRFVEIKEEPVEIKKQPAPPSPQKKSTKEPANIPGENKAKIIPKNERKPVEAPKGKEIKRKIIKPEKKAVVPPKEKKLTKPKKKESQKKVTTPQKKVNEKKQTKPTPANKNVNKNTKPSNQKSKSIKAKEKKKSTIPPPPEKPDLEINANLEPVNNPDITGLDRANLDGIQGFKDKNVNVSKIASGLKTVKPAGGGISFGQPLKELDNNVQGSGAARKIEYMPPPPLIKTRLPAPPKSVKVKIEIAPDGSVEKVYLLRKTGDPLLDKSILSYLYRWKFNPISSNEVQVAVLTVKFKPNN